MTLDDDLAAMRARRKLFGALDDLGIDGRIRAEMIDDPERALSVLASAHRRRRRIRNLTGYVVHLWIRLDRRRPPAPDPEPGPPTLATLEYAWHLQDQAPGSPLIAAMIDAYAIAIARNGGLARLRPVTRRQLSLI